MFKNIAHGVLHTVAGAGAFAFTALVTGWHPGTSPLADVLWSSLGVTLLSGLAHTLAAYANRK